MAYARENRPPTNRGSADRAQGVEELRRSPTMAHLLDALRKREDVGHYGRLVFAMVARHFMSEEEIVKLLARQPEQDEDDARALVTEVNARNYCPPKRERLLDWQAQQEFPLVPDAEDLDSGNLYAELRFPDSVYEEINEYYEEKAKAQQAA